jgi:hypothetical protein
MELSYKSWKSERALITQMLSNLLRPPAAVRLFFTLSRGSKDCKSACRGSNVLAAHEERVCADGPRLVTRPMILESYTRVLGISSRDVKKD